MAKKPSFIGGQHVKPGPTTCDLGLLNDGTVVIQFSEPVKQMTFTPEQATGLGVGFIQMGTRGESLQRVSPPEKTAQGSRRIS
jgi:hypothetical protein